MNNIFINNYSVLQLDEDFKWKDISSRPNERFGRYDQLTKVAIAAVEKLHLPLDRDKDPDTALILATGYGCLAVDYHFLKDKQENPPSPTLFTYTLPSVALGEIAIRYRLTGANLTILDQDKYGRQALIEGAKELQRGECQRLILIMADGLSSQILPLIGQKEALSTALALELSVHNQPATLGTLSLEKMTGPQNELLPPVGLLDYLSGTHAEPWQLVSQLGLNFYNLTLSFFAK